MNWQMLYNPIMIALLRSPLHGFISKNTLLITFTGRRSGKQYTTPVNYIRDGNTLLTTSTPDRTWWKNLRGGVTITVRVQGQDFSATGEAIEDEAAIATSLLTILQKVPASRRYLKIELDSDGQPAHPDQLVQAAQNFVIILTVNLTSLQAGFPQA